MRCGKDLAEGEKVLVIKETARVKTNKSIAERINRCVITKIGESEFLEKSFEEDGFSTMIIILWEYGV